MRGAVVTPEPGARSKQRQELIEELRHTLVRVLHLRCDPDEIDPDAPLFGTGLGLDSIDALELVVAVKKRFDLPVDDVDEGLRPLRSLNHLVDLVLEKRGGEA